VENVRLGRRVLSQTVRQFADRHRRARASSASTGMVRLAEPVS